MKITYTLKDFNSKRIIDKYGMQKDGNTQLFLANTCFRRMQKYVPFDTGALSTTATVKPGSVTYEQPYAHRQYTTNKGKGIRGKYWDKKMVANEKDQLAKEVENYAKKMKGSR
jgi:hypothetical protein